MQFRRLTWLCLALGAGLAVGQGAWAQTTNWARYALISPTSTLSAGRLCYTDGVGIACDANAPTMSGLGVGDRIVSGTSSVVAANGGPVSVTIAGANVANFGSGGLGTTNINASGAISATGTGYFADVVGVRISPSGLYGLEVSGTVLISASSNTNGIVIARQNRNWTLRSIGVNSVISNTDGSFNIQSNNSISDYYLSNALGIFYFYDTSSNATYFQGTDTRNGLVGINISNTVLPTANLEVSGTMRLSGVIGAGACAVAGDIGKHRQNGSYLEVCSPYPP